MAENHLDEATIFKFAAEAAQLSDAEARHFDQCRICGLRVREAIRRRAAEAEAARAREKGGRDDQSR